MEKDAFCQEIIRSRIKDGLAEEAPLFSDITSFVPSGDLLEVEGLTLGFPCQVHVFESFMDGCRACAELGMAAA